MNRLLEIGFQYAGYWSLAGGLLECSLLHHEQAKNVLYTFICNGEIKYIGKTTQPFYKRMAGYKKPGNSQSTNIKNNANIKALLNKQLPVDIFVLPDNGLLNYGGFLINLAAGLEDSLIEQINPIWNRTQKQEERTISAQISENIQAHTVHTFQLQLGTAYYNQGFINIPIKFDDLLGGDGDEIEIYLADELTSILGYINRTATSNKAPRIMGGKLLKSWIQENRKRGQFITVNLLGKNKLQIEPV